MGNLKNAFLFHEMIVDKYGKVSREGVSDNDAAFFQFEILVDAYGVNNQAICNICDQCLLI